EAVAGRLVARLGAFVTRLHAVHVDLVVVMARVFFVRTRLTSGRGGEPHRTGTQDAQQLTSIHGDLLSSWSLRIPRETPRRSPLNEGTGRVRSRGSTRMVPQLAGPGHGFSTLQVPDAGTIEEAGDDSVFADLEDGSE